MMYRFSKSFPSKAKSEIVWGVKLQLVGVNLSPSVSRDAYESYDIILVPVSAIKALSRRV